MEWCGSMELPLRGIFSLPPPLPSGLSPTLASVSAAHAGTSPARKDKHKRSEKDISEKNAFTWPSFPV